MLSTARDSRAVDQLVANLPSHLHPLGEIRLFLARLPSSELLAIAAQRGFWIASSPQIQAHLLLPRAQALFESLGNFACLDNCVERTLILESTSSPARRVKAVCP